MPGDRRKRTAVVINNDQLDVTLIPNCPVRAVSLLRCVQKQSNFIVLVCISIAAET